MCGCRKEKALRELRLNYLTKMTLPKSVANKLGNVFVPSGTDQLKLLWINCLVTVTVCNRFRLNYRVTDTELVILCRCSSELGSATVADLVAVDASSPSRKVSSPGRDSIALTSIIQEKCSWIDEMCWKAFLEEMWDSKRLVLGKKHMSAKTSFHSERPQFWRGVLHVQGRRVKRLVCPSRPRESKLIGGICQESCLGILETRGIPKG